MVSWLVHDFLGGTVPEPRGSTGGSGPKLAAFA
jgi:hypothetical protein